MRVRALLGRVAYGLAFAALLPALLAAWALGAAPVVALPATPAPVLGIALGAASFALILWAVVSLRIHGGGLPMNAFPPPRHVSRGPYRLFSHPIYVGFCGAVLAAALFTGSASGLYLVFPGSVLGCAALVFGFERPDLLARFGRLTKPWLALPPPTDERPTLGDRLSAYALVILPWAAIYEALAALGPSRDAIETALPFERSWPVLEWAEAVYASAYAGVLLAPFLVARRRDLRRLCTLALLAMALVFPLYLALPLVATPRPFEPSSALGRLLAFERAHDTAACAFPSFHAIWALAVACALAPRTRLAWAWAAAVSLACLATGMHTLADVAAGAFAFLLVLRADRVWAALRRATERVANSFGSFRLGPVRFINYGLYAGLGTALALAIIGAILGPGSSPLIVALFLGGLVGAGLWAQVIEGASGLSRPYGFYGGMLGMLAVGLAAPLFGEDRLLVLAACCVGGPFVQSLGRIRCLVQGCCHGSLCPPDQGIRYRHPLSRVTRIAALAGQPVYPTPLYSILWNVPIALAMARLASLGADAALVVSVYLVLSGCGRFVEESYRGEPQTPIVWRLRLYQWVAVATVLAGVLVGAFASGPPVNWHFPETNVLVAAALCGFANVLALGVDFPESKRRFSRLA